MIAHVEAIAARTERERAELDRYRAIAPAIDRFLCEYLAAQGDHADPDLVRTQHALADVCAASGALPSSVSQPEINQL